MVSQLSFSRFWMLLLPFLICFHVNLKGQTLIKGTVMTQEGDLLSGAIVQIKGSRQGTITDGHGIFALSLQDPASILEIKYPEYKTAKVSCKGKRQLIVQLSPKASRNTSYTKGYISASTTYRTGAVSTLEGETLQQIPSASFDNQLQGRLAGVMVGANHQAGGESMLRIRGFGTLNHNDPLIVIDGVPVAGDFHMLSPDHIDHISVLKDASAAAIYGARAGNGVLLISTKKGKKGKARLHISSRYGIQQASSQHSLLNTQQLGELLYTAQKNDYLQANPGNPGGFVFQHAQYGLDPGSPDFLPDYVFPSGAMKGDPGTAPSAYSAAEPWHLITEANQAGTDWQSEIFTPAPIQNHTLGMSGGSKYSSYYMGVNYLNQQGILDETGFQRFSLRSNSSFSPNPWIRVGEQLEVSYGRMIAQETDLLRHPASHAIRMHPMIPVLDIMGNYAGTKGAHVGNVHNPVAQLNRNKDNVSNQWKIIGSAFLELDILKNLRFKSQFGVDYQSLFANTFTIRSIEHAEPAASNSLRVDFRNRLSWTLFNLLDYRWKFGKIHQLQLLAGQEASEGKSRYLFGARDNFYSDDLSYRFLNAGTTGLDNGHGGSEFAMSSFFGHGSYVFLNRYMIEANVRRDGSSRFGPNNRYGLFYGGSIGWRLSEELFLLGVPGLNVLTLRAGWGKTGNQEIADDAAYSTYRSSLSASSYDIWGNNQQVVSGFDSQRFGNPNVKWENTQMINIGLDLELFRSIRLQADWYKRTTSDMLLIPGLSGVLGEALAPYRNQGQMVNTGIDVSFGLKGHLNSRLGYDLQANVSTYRNTLVSLGELDETGILGPNLQDFSYTRSVPGYPISSFWGLETDGFISEKEVQDGQYDAYYDRPGRFRYVDQNQDGRIDEEDHIFLGSPHPDVIYGLSGSLNLFRFDLGMFVQGMFGNELLNYSKAWTDFAAFQSNRSHRMLHESWTPSLGNQASLPVLSQQDNLSHQPSSYFVEDGSYIRVKQLELGYTLGSMRLYCQAINLFTFTGYEGLDPEIPLYQANTHLYGIDIGTSPTPKTILFGMNIGF
ncbi:MAG: SusC/RagA family TonB-linked outer membrane protein [Bacteroidota bacterium]